MSDDFFTPLENDAPYLKMGAQGFAGAGKTYTLFLVAAGLHKRIRSTKPIVIFDTERSSKFLRQSFSERGISVLTKKSRSLTDLHETIVRCEQGASDILLIDSLSHVWDNWLEEFKAEKRITDLQFQHWGQIKPVFKKKFSDPFVNSAVHILMTGRAAFTYGHEKNEETGRKELVQTGVKMRVEGETAYEPDLLIEMQRIEQMVKGKRTVHRDAVVLKDRSTLLDGKTIENPTYESFAPVIEYLLADPAPKRENTQVSDAGLVVGADADADRKKKWTILLEEIEALLAQGAPGRTAEEKAWVVEAMDSCFATKSWTRIKSFSVENLELGKTQLERMVAQRKASRKPAAG